MMTNFHRLQKMEAKDSRWILGLMSGTSMDGLDIALCEFKGNGTNTEWKLHAFETMPHTPIYKEGVRKVFARKDAFAEDLLALHQEIAEDHALKIQNVLDRWGLEPERVDMIASHGQTVYHAPGHQAGTQYPDRNLTLQLGDGDVLAAKTGIVTISDFRQKHIAHGGEGAPLAPYGDVLLFSDEKEDRVLLNIGGIANFTYVPSRSSSLPVISSDTGPGNTIMDAYMREHFSKPYDKDGRTAEKGVIHESLLKSLLEHSYFDQSFPKTTGPEVFSMEYLTQRIRALGGEKISHEDVMATLNAFTAHSIAQALKPYGSENTGIYISGGGGHNPVLVQQLKDMLPQTRIKSTALLGLDPDAKEAVIFALLANECLFGEPWKYPVAGGGMPPVTMGKISFP